MAAGRAGRGCPVDGGRSSGAGTRPGDWASGQTAALLACEGGDFLDGRLEALAEARGFGACVLTLVHYRVNDIGDVQTEPPVHGGLTAFGREVVAECNRLGMIIACTQPSPTTAAVLEASREPVMISHSHLDHPGGHHPRLLSPAHARAVADAGGLIGAWPAGVTAASLADFADAGGRRYRHGRQ